MSRYLITGANGMLGKSLCSIFSDHLALNGRQDLDLTDLKSVENFLQNKIFDTIIHSAAYTDLNFCEENKEKAFTLHSEILPLLHSKCNTLVYISTNPSSSQKNYYKSKREGEERCVNDLPDSIVVKTNIYGRGGLSDWAIKELAKGRTISGYTNVIFNAVHVDQLSSFLSYFLLNKQLMEDGQEVTSDPNRAKFHISNYLKYKSKIVSFGGDYSLSKYDFLKFVSVYLGLDSSLVKPTEAPEPVNLTVERNDLSPSLSEGLEFLKKNYG